jgi:hypothetical protein
MQGTCKTIKTIMWLNSQILLISSFDRIGEILGSKQVRYPILVKTCILYLNHAMDHLFDRVIRNCLHSE